MAEDLRSANLAGSLITATTSGTAVALDVNITAGNLTATVDSAFVNSGNVFLVSGNAWTGVGSAYTTNGATSSNQTNGGQITRIFNTLGNEQFVSASPGVIMGSVAVTTGTLVTSGDVISLGSPSFKTVSVGGSDAYTQVWTLANTGSRLEVHGWNISTNSPGLVQLFVSGGTPVLIKNYYLNFASGATIEKTFVSPIIPGGAGLGFGVGTTCAGSTDVCVFGRLIT